MRSILAPSLLLLAGCTVNAYSTHSTSPSGFGAEPAPRMVVARDAYRGHGDARAHVGRVATVDRTSEHRTTATANETTPTEAASGAERPPRTSSAGRTMLATGTRVPTERSSAQKGTAAMPSRTKGMGRRPSIERTAEPAHLSRAALALRTAQGRATEAAPSSADSAPADAAMQLAQGARTQRMRRNERSEDLDR